MGLLLLPLISAWGSPLGSDGCRCRSCLARGLLMPLPLPLPAPARVCACVRTALAQHRRMGGTRLGADSALLQQRLAHQVSSQAQPHRPYWRRVPASAP